MILRDRERLVARIRQLRRARAQADEPAAPAPERTEHAQVDALEDRVAHLEQMVEGLQDSVHREMERHDRLLAELQTQIQPAAIGAALNEDARNRGL